VIGQTRTRLGGTTPDSATRLVSLHDPDARPIRKGRLGKPVEFGYKAQVVDNTDGIVLDHSVHRGNPADAPLLAPAIARIKDLLGRTPRAVTADRGYGEAKTDEDLTGLGVRNVVIPRKGKPSAARRTVEHRRGFRRLVKWRTGSEGRISYLKGCYGMDRTLFDGLEGAQAWCALAVLAHNTVKIAALIESKRDDAPAAPAPTRRRKPAPTRRRKPAAAPRATGPPGEAPPMSSGSDHRPLHRTTRHASGLLPAGRAGTGSREGPAERAGRNLPPAGPEGPHRQPTRFSGRSS
jgi:IS5 family transposase